MTGSRSPSTNVAPTALTQASLRAQSREKLSPVATAPASSGVKNRAASAASRTPGPGQARSMPTPRRRLTAMAARSPAWLRLLWGASGSRSRYGLPWAECRQRTAWGGTSQ